MTIIDPYVALTLLVVTLAAAALAVTVLAVVASRLVAGHRRRRLARLESIPTYYRHLALGH